MKNSLVFALFVCAAFVGCSDDAPVLLNNSVKLDAGGTPDSSDTTGQTNNVVFPGDDAGQLDQGACSPDREDEPDPDFFDANCDGLDGDESQSVFVATYGDDTNPGTKALPKASVAAAVTTAAAEGKSWVLVAESFYDGAIELSDGVSIAGGYGFGWKRDGRAKTTFRMGSPVITGVNIQQRTVLLGFEVLGGSAPPGMTAAAVYLQASPGVVLSDLRITGGKGGDGMRGGVGILGSNGNLGVKGGDAPPDSGSLGFCKNQDNPPTAGNGGEPSCGSEDGRGAKGGNGGFNSSSGTKGVNGADGATGGAGGTSGSPGLEGSNGSAGMTGGPGLGATADGAFVDGQWQGQDGVEGTSGTAGEGGAGGGGGGGGAKSIPLNPCSSWGGAGGGGGSGGCGGDGGGGGQSGGASVGVLLLDSDVEIIDCTIIGGLGGRGGDGGDGGDGGMGGSGGAGGNLEENSGTGAKGGIGGRGGRGGQGGGGAGGPSIGLFSSGPLSMAPQASMVLQGEGGTGGAAGGAAGRGADGIAEAVRMP
jgi:hypothetical protein